jgi:oligogalacturonide lyase
MSTGRIWPVEWNTFTDHDTGVTVRQLTNYKGHSHHFYFTNPGWFDGGRQLIFGSDRENRANLFSLRLDSGEIRQLTDLAPLPLPHEVEFLRACLNPVRDEAYFIYGRQVVALDLQTLEQRVLTEMPVGYVPSMLNATADGRYVCVGIWEDLSDRIPTDLLRGYVGFAETWEAMPLSRILRVATDGAGAETVFEERYWIGHVNTSPTQPHLLTYCHEGPWDKVDNRIWGLDMTTGRAWPLRPREQAGETVGHEYWHADGVTIGYHGWLPTGDKCFGRMRYDGSERVEVSFPHETGHIHSNDWSLVVGDAGCVRLWQWNGTDYDGPYKLCDHRCSFHIQQTHVHPRFTPDGRQVLFTSDMSGYGNLYLVDVPEVCALPRVG